jgi:lipoate-protein ligase A
MNLDYKVPGGKLIRLQADIEDGKIKKICINGDFFIHPEEKIAELEKALMEKHLDREELLETVSDTLKGSEMVGISESEIVNALMRLS